MSVVQGVVEKVLARGNATNICVAGQWYGCGFNGVPCKEGDEVTFTATAKGNFLNADVASMQILSQGNSVPAPQRQQGGSYQNRPRQGGAGGGPRKPTDTSKDDYWKNKEERDVRTQQAIQYQAARNAAIAVCTAALERDILPLPGTKAKAFDAFLDAIDEVTARYNQDVTNLDGAATPVPAGQDDF